MLEEQVNIFLIKIGKKSYAFSESTFSKKHIRRNVIDNLPAGWLICRLRIIHV